MVYSSSSGSLGGASTLSQTLETGNKKTEYIVTYNHRRELFGIFTGVISLKLRDWTQKDRILNNYQVEQYLSAKPYMRVKLKNLAEVSSVLASLKNDSNVSRARIVVKEDFPQLH